MGNGTKKMYEEKGSLVGSKIEFGDTSFPWRNKKIWTQMKRVTTRGPWVVSLTVLSTGVIYDCLTYLVSLGVEPQTCTVWVNLLRTRMLGVGDVKSKVGGEPFFWRDVLFDRTAEEWRVDGSSLQLLCNKELRKICRKPLYNTSLLYHYRCRFVSVDKKRPSKRLLLKGKRIVRETVDWIGQHRCRTSLSHSYNTGSEGRGKGMRSGSGRSVPSVGRD